jgi:hypothetical protein
MQEPTDDERAGTAKGREGHLIDTDRDKDCLYARDVEITE